MLEPSVGPVGPGSIVPPKKQKVPNGDHVVLHFDQCNPNGKVFRSSSFTAAVPTQPMILENRRHNLNGYETMVSVSVEPTDAAVPDLGNFPQYECSIRYFNNTNRAIVVTDKHNISFTMPKPRQWAINNKEFLIVRKTHTFTRADIALSVLQNHNEARAFLSVDDEELQQILQRIEEERNNAGFRNINRTFDIIIDRIIPVTLFNEYQSIYVSDLDVLFREEGRDIGTPHPTSEDAILRGEVLSILEGQPISGFFFQIVDNENLFGVRYMNVGSQLMQIPTVKNPSKPSGIYHTSIENSRTGTVGISLKQTPLTGGEELGIYKTRDEAEACGNTSAVFELRLNEAKRELKMKELENETIKAANEQIKAANDQLKIKLESSHLNRVDESKILHHEQEIAKLTRESQLLKDKHDATMRELIRETQLLKDKHELVAQELSSKLAHALEQVELERKKYEFVTAKLKTEEEFARKSKVRDDLYEERSAARKDTSEFVKWAPAILGAAVGLGGLAIAYQRSGEKEKDLGLDIFDSLPSSANNFGMI